MLCAWDGQQSRGQTVILNIDTAVGVITAGQEYEFDLIGETPDIARIDDTHYISVYKGSFDAGWAVLYDIDPPQNCSRISHLIYTSNVIFKSNQY